MQRQFLTDCYACGTEFPVWQERRDGAEELHTCPGCGQQRRIRTGRTGSLWYAEDVTLAPGDIVGTWHDYGRAWEVK